MLIISVAQSFTGNGCNSLLRAVLPFSVRHVCKKKKTFSTESTVTMPDQSNPMRVSAQQVVQERREIQKRRRKSGERFGSGTKKSLWSTVAAYMYRDDIDTWFMCKVCNQKGQMKKGFSTSKIINHYKIAHPALQLKLMTVNEKCYVRSAWGRYWNRPHCSITFAEVKGYLKFIFFQANEPDPEEKKYWSKRSFPM